MSKISLLTLISGFVVLTMIGCTKEDLPVGSISPQPPPPPKVNHANVILEQETPPTPKGPKPPPQVVTNTQTQLVTH